MFCLKHKVLAKSIILYMGEIVGWEGLDGPVVLPRMSVILDFWPWKPVTAEPDDQNDNCF